MKKITSVLMLSMAFVLASCGGGSTGLSVSESSTPAPSASSETSASSSVAPTSSSVTPTSSSATPTSSSVAPASSSSESPTPEPSSSETSASSEASSEQSSSSEPAASSSEADPTYVVSVNDLIVNVAVTKPSSGTDKGYFELALEANDVVKVTFGASAINFAGYNGNAYAEPASAFTAENDGDHKFYITDKDVIWVTRQEDHSGEQTVDLYTKFSIPDDKAALVAYAWVWADGQDGAWALATHDTAYAYDKEWDRHYTCTVSDPVGKKVILAIFSADSGVDADHEPNATWDGCVVESGTATIEDWTTSVGANVYGQS